MVVREFLEEFDDFVFEVELIAYVNEVYNVEFRYMDSELVRLWFYLFEDVFVVFFIDHGEGIDDYGGWFHGVNMHVEVNNVIVWFCGSMVIFGVISVFIVHEDILLLMVKFVGWEVWFRWIGIDPIVSIVD